MVVAAILIATDAAEIEGLPLALLPWQGDETLIECHIAQLQAAGVDVIDVVLGHEAERIIPLVARDNVEPIVDGRWRADAASAVRAGATAVPRDTDAAIIVRVDEPRPSGVYRRLLDEHLRSGAAITRAAFEGTPGTPIVVDRAVLAELRNATDAAGGLEGMLARHASAVLAVEFEDGVVLMRMETAEEYEAARESGAFD
jgi:molybdenum cofactor cytidylyltransferase